VVISGLLLTAGGCSGIVNKEQMEEFFARLGNVSMTVYPAYVKRMTSDSGYDFAQADRLTSFLRCECLAEVTVSTEEVPVGG